jgi:hypothetical protein
VLNRRDSSAYLGTRCGKLASNSSVKRRSLVTMAASSVIAGVLGLLSYRLFHSPPLARAVFSPKPPVQPKDCSGLGTGLASFSTAQKPVESAKPLREDEVAIYTAVIREWLSGSPASLNISARNSTLKANSLSTALIDCACSAGIQLESLLSASHSYHRLTPGILPVEHLRLVDPNGQATIVHDNDPNTAMRHGKSSTGAVESAVANGLFTLSEIAFDAQRKHALVSYSFVCGSLCGSGNTWVFEKAAGEWKKVNLGCGGWVS